MSYFDLNMDLTQEDKLIKNTTHEFARDFMRPVAQQLDEMTPQQVIAEDSPFWEFMRKAYELDYHAIILPDSVGGMGLTPLQEAIAYEELAWGSFGLTVAIVVSLIPPFLSNLMGSEEIVNDFVIPFCRCKDASIRGCWGITEPDHGSDTLMAGYPSFQDSNIPAQCTASLHGKEWVINGQKSAWVSCGTVATHCALFCQIEPSMGHAGSGIFLVPLDRPGIKRGQPLNKLGQRDLNQGEIFFDNVSIPDSHALLTNPKDYEGVLEAVLSITTAFMGIAATGLARAAFDEALAYAKERVQGGKALIEHKNVQIRLFRMFQQVETSRLISRAAWIYNRTSAEPAEEYSIAAKIHGTEAAFNVSHEAIQIMGGYGLTKECITERLFRDARATLIEDGSNDILALSGAHKVIGRYPRRT